MKAPPTILVFRLVTTTIIIALLLLFILSLFGRGPLAGRIPVLANFGPSAYPVVR